eukprot:1394114-Ditylum_brightwellii.AAC.1
MGEQSELLDKSVSILNFTSLKADDNANDVLDSAKLNNAIEDMLEVIDSKRSKVNTMVNIKGAWDSKEHVLECIANILLCWQYTYDIDSNNPPLLFAILYRTADLIAEKEYKS